MLTNADCYFLGTSFLINGYDNVDRGRLFIFLEHFLSFYNQKDVMIKKEKILKAEYSDKIEVDSFPSLYFQWDNNAKISFILFI